MAKMNELRRSRLFRALSCMLVFIMAVSMCLWSSVSTVSAKTYYANDIVSYALSQVGKSTAQSGCMAWVNGSFKNVYGWTRQGCCAYTYGKSVHKSSSMDDIPLGAIVYFQYTDSYPYSKVKCSCGNYAGHVGIYVGDGMMVHSFNWADGKGSRVCKDKISKIVKPSLYKYCGWGWYNKTALEQTPEPTPTPTTKTATIKLETSGGQLQGSYGSWGEVKTTTTKPTESDNLRITDTKQTTTYKYFHYHNSYSGSQMMIDSIKYTGNWAYCEMTKDSAITKSKSFQDKGGRTSVKVGDKCKYGYTLWFEDKVTTTTYYYQERSGSSVSDTITVGSDGVISTLPAAEKDGYDFVCWNTSADGSGTSYYPGTNVKFGSITAGACYTLYAIYKSSGDESSNSTDNSDSISEDTSDVDEDADTTDSGNDVSVISGEIDLGTIVGHTPSSDSGVIQMVIGNPVFRVNGSSKAIDKQGSSPVIKGGRTLLPVRAVIEAMGGSVEWNADARVVSMERNGKSLYMRIGDETVWNDDGDTYTLDSTPQIINSRTMLPIRFIAEYFDASVDWDADSKTISISY